MKSEHKGPAPSPSGDSWASALVLSAIFASTGIGTTLLGAALPALLTRWSLSDRGAGWLFLVNWLGAALGALLSRGSRAWSVARGLALAAVCGLALAGAKGAGVYPLTLGYGLGLGIAMTSISLLRSERAGERRPQELNRLNLLWALGALSCPAFATRALLTGSPAYLFTALGGVFALGGLWVALFEQKGSWAPPDEAPRLAPAPPILCLFASLAVGTEASLGSWLTTYVKRADGSVAGAVTATTAFWAGLLFSRALYSTPWMRRAGALPAFRAHSWMVAAAVLPLCFAVRPATLLALAFALGCGLGPLYPVLLAFSLPRYRGNRIFLFAGLGSAVLPWCTGALSSGAGSLRGGLAAPCAGGLLLALMSGWQPRDGAKEPGRRQAHGILRGGP